MGRLKVLGGRAENRKKAVAKAQKMGQMFASEMTPRSLREFLEKTGIGEDLFEIYEQRKAADATPLSKEQFMLLCVQDYQLLFGQTIALSYAIGYIDREDKRKINDLGISDEGAKAEETPSEDDEKQLVLPGIL